MTVLGTRPEIIRLSRVIAELDRQTYHVLVHTGQNYDYELNEIFFEQLEIRRPDHFLAAASRTAAATIGNVIARADGVRAKARPDALLLLGDTNSCLAVIAAKRRRIPVFHMEAGNRCFDERVPEEFNRRLVDHAADINLPYTEHARRYLLREGIRPETVIKTGSPVREVLAYYAPKIEASRILARLKLAARVEFLKPLGFVDYVKLQTHACCVLSDNGTLTEESSLLAFPAVMLREAHERPEGMDEGTFIMSGLKPDRVLSAIDITLDHCRGNERPFRIAPDYESDNVSRKVVRTILSYVDYVNRAVWFRQ